MALALPASHGCRATGGLPSREARRNAQHFLLGSFHPPLQRAHQAFRAVHLISPLGFFRSSERSPCLLGVSASSFAEHRLCFRDSCRFWNVSGRKLLQSDPFVNEQPALPADAAAVSGKTPISADDSVARNHNGNRVCRIGQANRTDGFRAAQLSRQRPITQCCTGLDRSECRPNLALKRGASGSDGDRIDRAEIAQEVVADRPPNCRGCGAVLYSEVISFSAIMEPKKTPHDADHNHREDVIEAGNWMPKPMEKPLVWPTPVWAKP